MQCIRCGLLLQMSHVAWSVCLSVRVGYTDVLCDNSGTNRDAVWRTDSCGSKEPCIRWGQVMTNQFAAARDDKSVMRPFVILLCTLLSVSTLSFICIEGNKLEMKLLLLCWRHWVQMKQLNWWIIGSAGVHIFMLTRLICITSFVALLVTDLLQEQCFLHGDHQSQKPGDVAELQSSQGSYENSGKRQAKYDDSCGVWDVPLKASSAVTQLTEGYLALKNLFCKFRTLHFFGNSALTEATVKK